MSIYDAAKPLRAALLAVTIPGGTWLCRMSRGATTALWCLVALLVWKRSQAPGGADFAPMWDAATALTSGQSLYGVSNFVYPPFAAVFFVPFAMFAKPEASTAYGYVQVLVPSASMAVVGYLCSRRWRYGAAAVASLVMLKADVFANSLYLGNATLLFVAPLVAWAVLSSRARWGAGAGILGLSLAVKPLLLLVPLVALVRMRVRPSLITAGACILPTLIALLVADSDGLEELPRRILGGTNLHGDIQALNVSLSSVAVLHPGWAIPLLLVRLVLVVMVAALMWRSRTWAPSLSHLLVISGALAALPSVVGSISEIHYCVLLLPAVWALVMGRYRAVPKMLGAAALLVLTVPTANVGLSPFTPSEAQLRWALGSCLALLACASASAERTSGAEKSGNRSLSEETFTTSR